MRYASPSYRASAPDPIYGNYLFGGLQTTD